LPPHSRRFHLHEIPTILLQFNLLPLSDAKACYDRARTAIPDRDNAISIPYPGALRGMKEKLSLARARRIALAAQGFANPRPTADIGRRHLDRVLGRLQLLQIDSV